MRFKIYKSSVLATIVSILGAVSCYAGILALFGKEFLAGIICIVIGILIQVAAGEIAENAAFKKWKKEVISRGYAQRIAQGDYSVAVQLYNQNPGEKTLKYFGSLNSNVAFSLRSAVQASSGNQNTNSGQTVSKPAPKANSAGATFAQGARCSVCGAALGAGDAFCIQCGTKVAQVKRCKQCGSKLDDDVKFCYECGSRV